MFVIPFVCLVLYLDCGREGGNLHQQLLYGCCARFESRGGFTLGPFWIENKTPTPKKLQQPLGAILPPRIRLRVFVRIRSMYQVAVFVTSATAKGAYLTAAALTDCYTLLLVEALGDSRAK